MSEPLPRILDPDALDKRDGEPRGRVSILVPQAWLREGARLALELPTRLGCDLCHGGGCDGCGRSGAYRLPDGRAPVAITLPRVTDDVLALRVTNPVPGSAPAILLVRVAAAPEPSKGVAYLGPNHDQPPTERADGGPATPPIPSWLRYVFLVVIAASMAIMARRCFG
jgi:hypothetical protein